MDMLLLGETVMGKGPGATVTTYLGFWLPTSGTSGVGAVEVFLVSGTVTLDIFTKSSDESDSAEVSVVAAPLPIAAGRQELRITNAKDLVRYKLNLQGAGTYIHFQFAQPLWVPN